MGEKYKNRLVPCLGITSNILSRHQDGAKDGNRKKGKTYSKRDGEKGSNYICVSHPTGVVVFCNRSCWLLTLPSAVKHSSTGNPLFFHEISLIHLYDNWTMPFPFAHSLSSPLSRRTFFSFEGNIFFFHCVCMAFAPHSITTPSASYPSSSRAYSLSLKPPSFFLTCLSSSSFLLHPFQLFLPLSVARTMCS